MSTETQIIFFCYARADGEFALRLATDLRSAGANIWIDQLDVPAGQRWDIVTEQALKDCDCLLAILSPTSVDSQNVRDELHYALDEKKEIVPVLYENCETPYRIRRFQFIDFTKNYYDGLKRLLNALNIRSKQTAELEKPTDETVKLYPQEIKKKRFKKTQIENAKSDITSAQKAMLKRRVAEILDQIILAFKKFKNRASTKSAIFVSLMIMAVFTIYIVNPLRFLSPGPLTFKHAKLEKDCSNCHVSFASVSDEKCSTCHELYGDRVGAYTLASHFLYRSDDSTRLSLSYNKIRCASCHLEHSGREKKIINISDSQCIACHEFYSFDTFHPEFQFARSQIPDKSNLIFNHIAETEYVMKAENLIDLEKACLFCHNLQSDGDSFKPINFDSHCKPCHSSTYSASGWLEIKNPKNPKQPGVETLEMIQQRSPPSKFRMNDIKPNDFQKRGNKVKKSPIYHQDAWILENVENLKNKLKPAFGLIDLLNVTHNAKMSGLKALYEEAIQTHEKYLVGLRERSENDIIKGLAQIDSLLNSANYLADTLSMEGLTLQLRLMDEKENLNAPRDRIKEFREYINKLTQPCQVCHLNLTKLDSLMHVSRDEINDKMVLPKAFEFLISRKIGTLRLTKKEAEKFESFINKLTEPCKVCHLISGGNILQVQKDQRVLHRSEFSHAPHILLLKCLDCHTQIPFLEYSSSKSSMDTEIDNSTIQNIPTIVVCQDCHNIEDSSNRCITCHEFHPSSSIKFAKFMKL